MNLKPEDFQYQDYLVSGEKFELIKYKEGVLKTVPVPSDLSSYYKSEDYISHTDKQESLQDQVYQFVKSKMLSRKAEWIEKEIPNGRIFDYGCGTGSFVEYMASRGWSSYGIEPDDDARRIAQKKCKHVYKNLNEIHNQKFSVITLWHVLEHVPDYLEILQRLISFLEPEGILIIAVPNHASYDAHYYKNLWAAWDVPRHLWHFTSDGIKNEMEDNFTLRLLKEKPLIFDSYYVSLLSEKNNVSSLPLIKAVKTGLISNLKARSSGEYSSLAYFFQKT